MLCLLCGSGGGRRRIVATAELQSRVRAHCKAGPFVHPNALVHDGPECGCCLTCLRSTSKRRLKRMLPMDQFLVWLLAPGAVSMDLRLWKRMRQALTSQGNPYASLGRLRALAAHPTPALATRAWWEANLRTRFFAHKETARLVRGECISPAEGT